MQAGGWTMQHSTSHHSQPNKLEGSTQCREWFRGSNLLKYVIGVHVTTTWWKVVLKSPANDSGVCQCPLACSNFDPTTSKVCNTADVKLGILRPDSKNPNSNELCSCCLAKSETFWANCMQVSIDGFPLSFKCQHHVIAKSGPSNASTCHPYHLLVLACLQTIGYIQPTGVNRFETSDSSKQCTVHDKLLNLLLYRTLRTPYSLRQHHMLIPRVGSW